MKRIYLAGSYVGARTFLRDEVAPWLQEQGYEITSRWLFEDHSTLDSDHQTRRRLAHEDLVDISMCNTLIMFTFPNEVIKGGKYVEWGYAYHALKSLVLVGPHTNVFTELASAHYPTYNDFKHNWPHMP